MTPTAHPAPAPAVDEPDARLRDAVASLEWVRRQLHAADSSHCELLGEIIGSAASSPNGPATLTHPWTTDWIDVAIRLIDRGALVLLPDGQCAAHFEQAVNLLAALRIGRSPSQIRFDRDGVAWLPGTGACAKGSRSIAGRTATLRPFEPRKAARNAHAVRWPEITSTVSIEGLDAQLCDADSLELTPRHMRKGEGESPSTGPQPAPTSAAVNALMESWPGRATQPSSGPVDESTPSELAALLSAQRIPVDATPNTLASGRIRLDSSFDHLSLLSIRSPGDFEQIARAAATGSDRLSRRIRAHIAYIERRYMDAAETYAALLAGCPNDTDLWRDVCWALRHAGREELVQIWVLHPAEVVHLANEVDWQADNVAEGQTAGGGQLDALVRYLEWVRDAVRTR